MASTWRHFIRCIGQNTVRLTSAELQVNDIQNIAEACQSESARLVKTTDIIPCYRHNQNMMAEGEVITAFFAAAGISEICLSWQRKSEAPLNFVLPPNVESVRVDIL